MSKRNEKISAYLDGEIHEDEIMSFSLSAEADDATTSTHYLLIGDVLRNEMTEFAMQDVSGAVSVALANENIIDQDKIQTPSSSVATMGGVSRWLTTSWLTAGRFRPLAGMAVAATVAVVMVVAVTQKNSQSLGQMANVQAQTEGLNAVVAVKKPLQRPPELADLSIRDNMKDSVLVKNSELNSYLNQHFATQSTLQSRMPYVRSVSYESEK